MSWVALFWILYGVGSTAFVIYLFDLGRTVASNRKELVEQEIERIRSGRSDETELTRKNMQGERSDKTFDSQIARLQVQRIFQPDGDHVAVQGVLEGPSCVINLPIRQGADVLPADSSSLSVRENVS